MRRAGVWRATVWLCERHEDADMLGRSGQTHEAIRVARAGIERTPGLPLSLGRRGEAAHADGVQGWLLHIGDRPYNSNACKHAATGLERVSPPGEHEDAALYHGCCSR